MEQQRLLILDRVPFRGLDNDRLYVFLLLTYFPRLTVGFQMMQQLTYQRNCIMPPLAGPLRFSKQFLFLG